LIRNNAAGVSSGAFADLSMHGAEAVTAHLDDFPPKGSSFVSYDKDIPRAMGREFGVAGEKVPNAYRGEYRSAFSGKLGAKGQMPGTVFRVDKTFRENAMKPKSMYQRTPDWNALPKGAVELFDGGKSRIHIFATGASSRRSTAAARRSRSGRSLSMRTSPEALSSTSATGVRRRGRWSRSSPASRRGSARCGSVRSA
jgi:hypothetical protein